MAGIILIAAAEVWHSPNLLAQGQPSSQIGLPINGVFSGGQVDSVQLNNGNLHIDIPLLHLPGIGMDTDIHYVYDSQALQSTLLSNGQTEIVSPRPLWMYQDHTSGQINVQTTSTSWGPCGAAPGTYGEGTLVQSVSFIDDSGSAHKFPISGYAPGEGPPGLSGPNCSASTYPMSSYSADTSGYKVTMNNNNQVASVLDKHGRNLWTNGGIEDENGNRITESGTSNANTASYVLTDTVNRTITHTVNLGSAHSGPPYFNASSETISYSDQNGNAQTITVNYTEVNFNFAAMCGQNPANCYSYIYGGSSPPAPQSVNVNLPSSFVLQNGETYTISYSNSGSGDIESITLPTGGVISYTWNDSATPGIDDTVASRTVTANGQANAWSYSYVYTAGVSGSTLAHQTVRVTDPGANDTVYTCTYFGTTLAPYGSNFCNMTQELYYSGSSTSGTLLATQTTGYTTTGVVLPTSNTFNWAATNQTTETDTQWDPGPQPPYPIQGQVSFGNKISEMVYDYGTGAKGALLSNTQYSYKYNQTGTYLTANMLDRVSSVSVYNSATQNSSTLVAQTNTAYDNFSQSSINGQGSLTQTSGTTQHDYTGYSTSTTLRGLPTSVSRYTGASTAAVVSYTNYNDLGKPTINTDGRLNSTSYAYGTQNAFVSSVTMPKTNGVSHTMTPTYDVNTGLLTSELDQNGQKTSYTYDSLLRPLITTRPDGGNTNISYPSSTEIDTTTTQFPDPKLITKVLLDGLGRTTETQLTSDSPSTDFVDTTYDNLGRVQSVSNPYRQTSDSTYGITSYKYDALGRQLNQCQPDNTSSPSTTCTPASSYLTWLPSGSSVTFTDEVGNQWKRTYDARGLLTKVFEPNGSSTSPSMETDYTYDTLGNLLTVTQCGATCPSSSAVSRSFTYDAMSRLIQAYNPEAGWTCYGTTPSNAAPTGSNCTAGYDGNGNLLAKTDARGVTVAYTYDALNRMTNKTYSGGGGTIASSTPPVLMNYDETSVPVGSGSNGYIGPHPITNGVGRLTSQYSGYISSGVAAAVKAFSYDVMGRVTSTWECWGASECSNTYGTRGITAAYDQVGNRTQLNDSASRTYYYSYDGAGHLQTAYNTFGAASPAITTQMVNSALYFANGAPQTMTTTNSTATITATWGMDNRLRVNSYQNLSSENSYTNYGYSLNYTKSGNVQSSSETAYNPASSPVSWSWAYNYDTLNRLANGKSSGNMTWGCSETYDQWGNRTAQAPYGGTGYTCTTASNTVTAGTNRPNGSIYVPDAAGNIPSNGSASLTYDAEGRIASSTVSGTTTTYLYGADGSRAGKIAGGVETNYLRDTDGSLLATYVGGNYANVPEEMWVAGKHFGTVIASKPNGITTQTENFALTNWLGSEAVRTNPTTGIPQAAFVSQPFGDFQTALFSTIPDDDIHFTGKERDTESGNDYFGARYYGSSMGRFLSPDEPFVGQHPGDPQSWNLYSYGLNNPTSNTDDDGHDVNLCDNEGHCQQISNEQYQAAQQGNNGGLNVPSLDSVGTNGSGNITDANGNTVGTATYVSNGNLDPYTQASGFATLSNAAGVVNAATSIEASIMAPWAGAVVGCMSGGSKGSCAANLALSILPEVGELKAGATLLREAAAAGKGAEILEKAGGVAAATKDFEALKGAEQVDGAVRIKTLSDGSKAVLYESTGGSGRTTISIQDATGHTSTKIRY